MSIERKFDVPPKDGWFPSEINKPFKEELTLEDFEDALNVDDTYVLAYKQIWGIDMIFVGRERTIPVKISKSKRPYMYPYQSEEELKGVYGVLYFNLKTTPNYIYVGRDYKIAVLKCYEENDKKLADIDIESTGKINAEFIDGNLNYNEFLLNLRKVRE